MTTDKHAHAHTHVYTPQSVDDLDEKAAIVEMTVGIPAANVKAAAAAVASGNGDTLVRFEMDRLQLERVCVQVDAINEQLESITS